MNIIIELNGRWPDPETACAKIFCSAGDKAMEIVSDQNKLGMAIRKQVPRKAQFDDEYNCTCCPTCGRAIAKCDAQTSLYCGFCGQRLNWEDVW